MQMRVRAKICGIKTPEDALVAAKAGADAIGMVFYEPSPRNVTAKLAAEICSVLPPFVSIVGLFVNRERSEILDICEQVPLSLLQFHGDETEADCLGYRLPYIKAVRVKTSDCVARAEEAYPTAGGLLVDTYQAGVVGGTGQTFDWSMLPRQCAKPLILAGGLNADNVRTAIDQVKPYAVDVSGGVESERGIKDPDRIIRFLEEVSSERNDKTN